MRSLCSNGSKGARLHHNPLGAACSYNGCIVTTDNVAKSDIPRGVIAEWTVTILLLLFGTTTLVQAFVIPTGSMEDTLLIGDHLLVDKLAYAPGGPVRKMDSPASITASACVCFIRRL